MPPKSNKPPAVDVNDRQRVALCLSLSGVSALSVGAIAELTGRKINKISDAVSELRNRGLLTGRNESVWLTERGEIWAEGQRDLVPRWEQL